VAIEPRKPSGRTLFGTVGSLNLQPKVDERSRDAVRIVGVVSSRPLF
jgi:hypothetical protein